MPTIEVLSGKDTGRRIFWEGETFFIGRDTKNHLVLRDRTVSRKHAVINLVDDRFVVSDLNSLKGLWVKGVKVREAILQEGTEFSTGDVTLKFLEGVSEAAVPAHQRKAKIWPWGVAASVLIAAAAFLWIFYFRGTGEIPAQIASQIETHYQAGIRYWNVDRDPVLARQEWLKVLKLDKEKRTPHGQKAAKLLKELEKINGTLGP